tara:strand:- start:2278 stop:3084 length:807 start_codon:yes stop_codon:yes gene_type:complete
MNTNQFTDVLFLSQFNKEVSEQPKAGLFYKIDKSTHRCYICVKHGGYEGVPESSISILQCHFLHLMKDQAVLLDWCENNLQQYEICEVVITGFRDDGTHALLLAEQMRKKVKEVTFTCVSYGVKYSTAMIINNGLFRYLHVTVPRDDYVHSPFYICNDQMTDVYLGKKSFDYYFTRLSGMFSNKSPELSITQYVSYIEFYNLLYFGVVRDDSLFVEGHIDSPCDLITESSNSRPSLDVPNHTEQVTNTSPWDIIVISDDEHNKDYESD